jgi:hypothetical protein
MGSPIRMAPTRFTSRSRNSALIFECTNTRVAFEHTWPEE